MTVIWPQSIPFVNQIEGHYCEDKRFFAFCLFVFLISFASKIQVCIAWLHYKIVFYIYCARARVRLDFATLHYCIFKLKARYNFSCIFINFLYSYKKYLKNTQNSFQHNMYSKRVWRYREVWSIRITAKWTKRRM